MMPDVHADGEIAIEISEHLNDLTSEELADFDVRFFANSTLRSEGELSPAEMEDSYHPMEGSWGVFDIAYESPRGTAESELAIRCEPGALSGFFQAADMIENYAPPMWEYTCQAGSRSAAVGPRYRFEGEGAFPEFLQGKVFVYDWSRRWTKYGEMVDGTFVNDRENDYKTPPYRVEMPATRLTDVRLFDHLTLTTPISMELGPYGSMYVAEYDGFWDPGENAQVTRYRWVADE